MRSSTPYSLAASMHSSISPSKPFTMIERNILIAAAGPTSSETISTFMPSDCARAGGRDERRGFLLAPRRDRVDVEEKLPRGKPGQARARRLHARAGGHREKHHVGAAHRVGVVARDPDAELCRPVLELAGVEQQVEGADLHALPGEQPLRDRLPDLAEADERDSLHVSRAVRPRTSGPSPRAACACRRCRGKARLSPGAAGSRLPSSRAPRPLLPLWRRRAAAPPPLRRRPRRSRRRASPAHRRTPPARSPSRRSTSPCPWRRSRATTRGTA